MSRVMKCDDGSSTGTWIYTTLGSRKQKPVVLGVAVAY